MKRIVLVVLAAILVSLPVAWSQRHDIRSRLSEATWSNRAPYKGSGKSAEGEMQVEWYEVDSEMLDRKLEQVAFIPEGGSEGRPLLVFLHGRGAHPGSFRKEIAAAFEKVGDKAPVIVQVAGGDHSYYHDRDDGPWGTYVFDEAIPEAVKRFDLDERRVAIGGYSMGGFGAYDIARLNPGEFCAVGGHSAAMWLSAGETPPGAFDDAEDFHEHDIIGAARDGAVEYDGMKLWLDGGDTDPFRPANAEFADTLRNSGAEVTTHTWAGGHSRTYWKAHFDEYLGFYSDALAACD